MYPTPLTYKKTVEPQELNDHLNRGWQLSDKGGLEMHKDVPGHILAKDFIRLTRENLDQNRLTLDYGEITTSNYVERIIRGHLTEEVGEARMISVVNASCPFHPTFPPGTAFDSLDETGYLLVTVRLVDDEEKYKLTIQDQDDGYHEFYSKDLGKIKEAFADLQREEVRTYDDLKALKIYFEEPVKKPKAPKKAEDEMTMG